MGRLLIQLLTIFIKSYQLFVSPLKPPTCRFVPSCSHYALEAIVQNGVLLGSMKSIWRLLKCHPFHPGGYDPV